MTHTRPWPCPPGPLCAFDARDHRRCAIRWHTFDEAQIGGSGRGSCCRDDDRRLARDADLREVPLHGAGGAALDGGVADVDAVNPPRGTQGEAAAGRTSRTGRTNNPTYHVRATSWSAARARTSETSVGPDRSPGGQAGKETASDYDCPTRARSAKMASGPPRMMASRQPRARCNSPRMKWTWLRNIR